MGSSFGTGTFKFGQDAQVWEDSEPRCAPAGVPASLAPEIL